MRNHPIAGCTENRRALYTIRTSITHSILNIPTHSFSDFVAANAVPPLGSKFFTKPNALMGFSIRTSATWLESKCLTKPKGCFPRTINRDTLRYPGWRCAIRGTVIDNPNAKLPTKSAIFQVRPMKNFWGITRKLLRGKEFQEGRHKATIVSARPLRFSASPNTEKRCTPLRF